MATVGHGVGMTTQANRITIIGATRGIGRLVLEQAVGQGKDVTVLVRDPSRLEPVDGEVRVVQGDATDPAAVRRAVRGSDAVIVALGAPALSGSTIRADGTQCVVDAMQAEGVDRLVCVSVYGALESRAHTPLFYRAVIFPLYLRKVMVDHDAQERIVRGSRLRWTLVRPPNLTDGPVTGDFHVGSFEGQALTWKIARADVAAFALAQVDSEVYVGAAPGVSYRKGKAARAA